MAQWLLHFQSIQVSSQLTVISNFTLEPDTYTRVAHPRRHIHTRAAHPWRHTCAATHGDIHMCGTPRETHTYMCGMSTKIRTHVCGTPKDSHIHINKNLKPFSSLSEVIFTFSKVFKLASVETNSAWGSSFMY